MRIITRHAARAFYSGSNLKQGNTKVTSFNGWSALYLHDNLIALRDAKGTVVISNAGWQSNTTKERLNGLNNVWIYQRKGQWFLNDQPWNGEWIKVN